MATTQNISTRGALARGASALAIAAALLVLGPSHGSSRPSWLAGLDEDELELVGFAGRTPDSNKPKLTAYFLRESYPRGGRAQLVIADTAKNVSVRFFRAGGEDTATLPNDVMLGSAASEPVTIGDVTGKRELTLRLGNWPSGMYYAQLTSGNRTGYAPFVVRPRALGEHKVAVVMPTESWQAYNFRDDNGDGRPDTWYVGGNTARLIRPFTNRGVPPHWKRYDAPFVRWLVQTGREVDYLSDQDLRTACSGADLARAYSLLIFSGHHEYVTEHEFDVVTGFRNRGGDLMFLSANNFFWKITIRDGVMTKVAQWRHLGRPEAALVGVGYRGNDRGGHRGPWIVRDAGSAGWLFAGTQLRPGEHFGSAGIEIDKTTPASPRSLHILAEVPNLLGPGLTGQMTYYETVAGARVFAAGAFTLAGSVWEPDIEPLMENLWRHMAPDAPDA
jgi:N,N-dimethylformamidase beta subunit-like, C-terminal